MEQILTVLTNFGAMGALAAVLLWLHHNSIIAFREELRAERQSSEKLHQSTIQDLHEHHQGILAEIKILNSTLQELISINKQNNSMLQELTRRNYQTDPYFTDRTPYGKSTHSPGRPDQS